MVTPAKIGKGHHAWHAAQHSARVRFRLTTFTYFIHTCKVKVARKINGRHISVSTSIDTGCMLSQGVNLYPGHETSLGVHTSPQESA